MKIGLVTCYINNYGACLQAHALSQKIEELCGECELVQYTPYYDLEQTVRKPQKSEPLLTKVVRAICHPIQFAKRQQYFRNCGRRDSKFEDFRNKFLKFNKNKYKTYAELKNSPPEMDGFVCGSDQLWNPVIHANTNIAAYYLDFAPKGIRRVAYAPSIGAEHVPEECQKEMGELINRMDFVSVREQRGADIIHDIIGRRFPVVLDPTMLYTGDWWAKKASPINIGSEYIFCYLFNENPETYEFISRVSRKLGLQVITLPYSYKDIYSASTKIYDAGPSEFLYLIQQAKIIITDSFHATAFSLNFNKDFYCIFRNRENEKNNMNSRIQTILGKLNLENRIIVDFDAENFAESPIDYLRVNAILKKEREEGEAFLRQALLSDNATLQSIA